MLLGSAFALIVAILFSGCAPENNSETIANSKILVVASTDVYGDIANQIGGDAVEVVSLINDPNKDPHEYEVDSRSQLALSQAKIVIQNGGGYDDFLDSMLTATENRTAQIVNIADISGRVQQLGEGELNEHFWYDFSTVSKFVDVLVRDLVAIDSGQAEAITSRAELVKKKLATLQQAVSNLATAIQGRDILMTEPLPQYLVDALGLINKTPNELSEAVESGTDIPPAVLIETQKLLEERVISVLFYNEQTTSSQTEAIFATAKKTGIPIVPVRETLPADSDYFKWMTANLDSIRTAFSVS